MSGQPGCPHCGGSGVIIDPDPLAPVRRCACRRVQRGPGTEGIPTRYRLASLDGFWEWWKTQHPKERIGALLAEAHQLVENPVTAETLREDLRTGLDFLVHKCGARMLPDGELAWKDLKPAQEPQGHRPLVNWARHDRDHSDLWWLDGPPGSGRSTLAAAALKAWNERTGKGGLFISVRAFSQELKDTYYDSISWKNSDFLSERDRMAPLLQAPCLVLDDLDRIDNDIRVVRAMAQLFDHRYAEELPTIITAPRWVEGLQSLGVEGFPFLRLDDASLLRRLAQSRRVVLRPTLERLMDVVRG